MDELRKEKVDALKNVDSPIETAQMASQDSTSKPVSFIQRVGRTKVIVFGILIGVITCFILFNVIKELPSVKVNNYLSSTYPGESFTVLGHHTETETSLHAGCPESYDVDVWDVKSNKTNRDFTVQEHPYFDSIRCVMKMSDNYIDVQVLDLLRHYGGNEILKADDKSAYINSNDFASESEMAEYIYNLSVKLKNDDNFERLITCKNTNNFGYFDYNINITDGPENYISTSHVSIYAIESVEDTLEKLHARG